MTGYAYTAHHRIRVHFAPENNRFNDLKGRIFLKGGHHLLFQHNPFSHMGWGHAVSKGLLHREEWTLDHSGVGEPPIFFVLDFHNTSGLGSKAHPFLGALVRMDLWKGRRSGLQRPDRLEMLAGWCCESQICTGGLVENIWP